jgi:hypothetical protein
MQDLHFEISDSGNLIRLDNFKIRGREEWVTADVTVKNPVFKGFFAADFQLYDFESLKNDFLQLVNDFNGVAKLTPLEDGLILNMKGDGLGHFDIKCEAANYNYGSLVFNFSFDQTQLPRLINELDKIIDFVKSA